jgi:hypothetical protein
VSTDEVRIHAEGWNQYLERQIAQRWPPVLRDWFPDGSDYVLDWHWKFFQYVFPIDDPRELSPLGSSQWSHAERAVLDRYLSHARDLADATVLTAPNGYTVNVPTPGSEPEITENVSARDATVGFLAMFRQFYAPDEAASFKRAYDLVAREMHRLGRDPQPVTTWRGAHAKLRHAHLDHLILVQASADGHVSDRVAEGSSFHPSETDAPQQMISAIFYGDSIHWGDKRSVIESWDKGSAVIAVKRRFDALRAAVQLGHLYVGFAAVVGLATGTLSPSEL